MAMNWPNNNRWSAPGWPWVAVGVVLVTSLFLQAGDPIIFPARQSSPKLIQNDPNGKELMRPVDEAPAAPAFTAPAAPAVLGPRRMSPRTVRRLNQQREEQKNWMFTDENGRSGDNAEDFGIRIYSYDGIEKESHQLSPTFKNALPSRNATPTPDRNPDEDSGKSANPGNGISGLVGPMSELGSHTSSELDLNDLLSPEQPAHADSDPGEALRDFLSGTASPRQRELESRRNVGNPFGTSKLPSALAGPLDPVNLPPGLSRQPMDPVIGKSPHPPGQGQSQGLFGPSRNLGSGRDFSHAAGSPVGSTFPQAASPARITGYSSLPLPALGQGNQPVRAWSSPGFSDPPRRKF